MKHILDGLNDAQREAVRHVDGPLLILAGPGSGKTRVVTHRIAWMLFDGVPSHEILALTFTNKAADEMRGRVERLVPHQHVTLSTFHSFAARLLRRHGSLIGLGQNFTIYDTDDSRRTLQQVIDRVKPDLMHHNVGQIQHALSWAKNRLIAPQDYSPKVASTLGMIVEKLYGPYQEQLLRSNAADFDDLLFHVAVLLRDHPELRTRLDDHYRYVMVDEYQDTNLAQYAIARALSSKNPNLAVTGDPDQSIYGWRGANVQNILDFEKDFPEVCVVKLEENYRSTQRILSAASHLIQHNLRRKKKELYTSNPHGAPVRMTEYRDNTEEASGIAHRISDAVASGERRWGDFALFYRTNALSRAFEFAFREAGVPFQLIHALEFYQRKEIKDLRAYLQLVNNPADDIAFLRVINNPRRGIGRTSIDRLSAFANRFALPLYAAAQGASEVEALTARARKQIAKFTQMMDRFIGMADRPVEEILGLLIAETKFTATLEESETEEDQERLANIQELLTVARQFDERYVGASALEGFLEETALAGDVDDFESQSDSVTLMTLHASKGLEFPVVFIVAAEEGLLPHDRSKDNEEQLEEERRLMFVGMTRAEEELQISRAKYRDFRGQRNMTVPSRFLFELPREELESGDGATEYAPEPVEEYVEEYEEEVWEEPVAEEMIDEPVVEPVEDWEFTAEEVPNRLRNPKPKRKKKPPVISGIMTAASMLGEKRPAIDPDAFAQGMVVMHDKHGIGTILALAGQGGERTATVKFATAGEQHVLLSENALRPLKK